VQDLDWNDIMLLGCHSSWSYCMFTFCESESYH